MTSHTLAPLPTTLRRYLGTQLWINAAEERSIAQHLDELLQSGQVRQDGDCFMLSA